MILTETKGMTIPVIVALAVVGIFILALIVVGSLKLIQVTIKQIKRNKKAKNRKVDANDAALIFGGLDNILETERQLNRILVKVKDKKLVQFEILKAKNIGTQITGNIIKCSSFELAEALEKVK